MSAPAPRRRFRALGGSVAAAVRLLRSAEPRAFWWLMITVVASGLLVGPRLIGVRDLLAAMTAPAPAAADFVLPMILITASTIVIEGASGLRPHLERVLDAAVASRAQQTILEVTGQTPYELFDDPEFHDALDRAARGAELRPVQVVQGVTALAGSLVGAATLLVAVLSSSLLVAGLILVAYVPAFAIQVRSGLTYYAIHHRNTQADRMRAYLVRLLTNRTSLAEMRFHGSDVPLAGRVADSWRARLAEVRSTVRAQLRRSVIGLLIGCLATTGAAVLLVSLFLGGGLTVATAGLLIVATWELGTGLAALGWGISNLSESALFLDDYVDFTERAKRLRTEPARVSGDPVDEIVSSQPSAGRPIALVDVGFAYPRSDRPALRHVDLSVAPGDLIALVGPTGAGKSTIARLLTGLYPPTSGELRWAGELVDEQRARVIKNRISVMPQDFGRFALTVRENIALADLDRADDDAALVEVAELAGLHDVITALPAGYDTRLGVEFEDGIDLSVGQWQRLALARSLFPRSDLLVLDEPTSALDPETERQFVARLRRLSRDKAVVIISHRYSTVARVDRIHVVDGGRIVQSGSHDTLLAEGGLYRRLFGREPEADGERYAVIEPTIPG